ncbi:MAG: tetratricopeptide repeat protein [Spirochaetaceae bacterium]|jgi:tetratricopeptide (TPR) repeat protein|nr:tetratricopeptide repeat protein [Spirochaetaceae bacterium]
MKTKSALNTAINLSHKKKYGQAAALLVQNIYNYRDNWIFYYTLSLASLYSGDAGAARNYVRTAYEIKGGEPQVLLLLAVLSLKRGDSGRAVNYYLKVLDADPKNPIALAGLKFIKKHSGGELTEWTESSKITRLYPRFHKKRKNPFSPFIVILAALCLAGGGFMFYKKAGFLNKPQTAREGFLQSALEAGEKKEAVEKGGGSWRYILTEKEVVYLYEKARSLFNSRRDDAARVEINRILLSNAAEGVKNKAVILSAYLEQPDFASIKDKYSYSQIAKEPELFNGCSVLWKGMAANIETSQNKSAFDLLVGYDTRNKLEGIVRVVFEGAVEVNAETPLEVLGGVAASGAEASGFFINGRVLHQRAAGAGR